MLVTRLPRVALIDWQERGVQMVELDRAEGAEKGENMTVVYEDIPVVE